MHNRGSSLDMYETYCGTDDVWVANKCISDIITYQPGTVYPLNWDFADFDWFYAMSFAYMNSGTVATKCYTRSPGTITSGTLMILGEPVLIDGQEVEIAGEGATLITALPSDACPTFISCCNYKGQAILGGIISTNATWTQLGMASVAWGAIGSWEFRPSSNRTAGFIRMPWADWDQGMVLKVARLGDRVIVYGNGGSCCLVPYTKENAIGFGLDNKVMGPGIESGFHWAGDYDKHLFIGNDHNLYLTNETGDYGKALGFKKLGYKEYIDELYMETQDYGIGTPICLSYDSLKRRFFISGPHSCYVLTEYGLYKCHQSTSGVGRYRGNKLTGFTSDLGDYEGRMTGDTIDMRLRGMKTVETIEFGVDGGSDLYGAVDFKYEYTKNSIYRSSSWKPLGHNGVVYPGITASDIRVKFKATDYRDGIKLDYANVKWKLTDKRSVRGLYNANKAQSGPTG
jgi:hypothetical protein